MTSTSTGRTCSSDVEIVASAERRPYDMRERDHRTAEDQRDALGLTLGGVQSSSPDSASSEEHEDVERGIYDFRNDQCSLPCMVRLACRHDVTHALGDPRGRRYGDRASYLTDSPHIARRVLRSQSREDLHSKVSEGLREPARDVDHHADLLHAGSRGRISPIDLTSKSETHKTPCDFLLTAE